MLNYLPLNIPFGKCSKFVSGIERVMHNSSPSKEVLRLVFDYACETIKADWKDELENGTLEDTVAAAESYHAIVDNLDARIIYLRRLAQAHSAVNNDCFFLIFHRLSPKDILACAQVCKKWAHVVDRHLLKLLTPTVEFERVRSEHFPWLGDFSWARKYITCHNARLIFYGLLLSPAVLAHSGNVFMSLLSEKVREMTKAVEFRACDTRVQRAIEGKVLSSLGPIRFEHTFEGKVKNFEALLVIKHSVLSPENGVTTLSLEASRVFDHVTHLIVSDDYKFETYFTISLKDLL